MPGLGARGPTDRCRAIVGVRPRRQPPGRSEQTGRGARLRPPTDRPGSVSAPKVQFKGRLSMRMSTRWLVVPVLLAAAGPAAAQSGDWTTYGGNDLNQRYSELKTITTTNVAQLIPRMIFQTGITKLGSFETTPLVTGGKMYLTTPYNTAIAYDLATKKELWRY